MLVNQDIKRYQRQRTQQYIQLNTRVKEIQKLNTSQRFERGYQRF